MKLFVILTVATLALGDKLDRTYLPASSRAQTAGGSGNILQTPLLGPSFNDVNNGFAPIDAGASNFGNGVDSNGFGSNTDNFAPNGNGFSSNEGSAFNGLNSFERPERPQAAFERTASILRQYNSNDGETYAYGFETENGITAEESGVATNGVQAKGSYSYIGDDGQVYSVTYTADENGYVPQGAHIPTAPPVPEEILKALEQNARDEAAGIFDDGSYDALKYGDASMPNSFAPSSFNGNNVLSTGNTFTDDAIVTDSALFLDNDTIRPPGYKNKGKNGRGQVQAAQPQPTLQGPAFQPINGFQPSSNVQPTAPANFRPQADLSGNKAYLPPRRNSGRNGVRLNARRPSFDERTGYNY